MQRSKSLNSRLKRFLKKSVTVTTSCAVGSTVSTMFFTQSVSAESSRSISNPPTYTNVLIGYDPSSDGMKVRYNSGAEGVEDVEITSGNIINPIWEKVEKTSNKYVTWTVLNGGVSVGTVMSKYTFINPLEKHTDSALRPATVTANGLPIRLIAGEKFDPSGVNVNLKYNGCKAGENTVGVEYKDEIAGLFKFYLSGSSTLPEDSSKYSEIKKGDTIPSDVGSGNKRYLIVEYDSKCATGEAIVAQSLKSIKAEPDTYNRTDDAAFNLKGTKITLKFSDNTSTTETLDDAMITEGKYKFSYDTAETEKQDEADVDLVWNTSKVPKEATKIYVYLANYKKGDPYATITVKEGTAAAGTRTLTDEATKITATGAIDKDAKLKIEEIKAGTENYNTFYKLATETDRQVHGLYDISIIGSAANLFSGKIKIEVPVKDASLKDGTKIEVYHMESNGTIKLIGTYEIKDQKLTFETDSLSPFMFTSVSSTGKSLNATASTSQADPNKTNSNSGSTSNSASSTGTTGSNSGATKSLSTSLSPTLATSTGKSSSKSAKTGDATMFAISGLGVLSAVSGGIAAFLKKKRKKS